METLFTIIAIIIVLALAEALINKFKSINWAKLLGILFIGGFFLAAIFSFTAESISVNILAYAALFLVSLLFAFFSKGSSNNDIRHEIAKNLLDILDDKTIADKTSLSIDDVKALRLKNKF